MCPLLDALMKYLVLQHAGKNGWLMQVIFDTFSSQRKQKQTLKEKTA